MTPEELPAGPVPDAAAIRDAALEEAARLFDQVAEKAEKEAAWFDAEYSKSKNPGALSGRGATRSMAFCAGRDAAAIRALKSSPAVAQPVAGFKTQPTAEQVTTVRERLEAAGLQKVAQPVTDERCVALDDVINVLTKRIQSRYQDHQRTDGETGERYFDTDHAEQMEAAYHAELGALSEVMTLKNAARAALCQSSTVQPVAVAMNLVQGDQA